MSERRFLCKVKNTDAWPKIPQIAGNAKPAIEKDASEILKEAGDDATIKRVMLNKVKKCEGCGKPNGFTLGACNSCGTSLVDTAVSFTTNVFTGFIFGIQKGPFPFTVSIRHQSPECLVIDDLLGLAPLHFNVIPCQDYIPDWRFLLRNPSKASELTQSLYAQCVKSAKEQFFSNQEWCKKVLKPGKFDEADFCAGFNYPPSQYQLHIQFMIPCFLPFQRYNYEKGIHFTHGRFFPVAYVLKCLEAASKSPLPGELLEETTPVESIIAHFKATHGIDYDTMHAEFYNNFKVLSEKYENWSSDDFEGEAREEGENGALKFYVNGEPAPTEGFTAPMDQDKMLLQNYGRPYTDAQKPTGSYYGFAKGLKDLRQW